VFSLVLEGRPVLFATAALAAVALLALSMPLTLAAVLERWRRGRAEAEVAELNARRHEALALATSALRETGERLSADRDRLARIAYLYDQSALARRIASAAPQAASPESALAASEGEVSALAAAVGELESYERGHPGVSAATPSIAPLPESAFVATGEFGWRASPLTGKSEFSAGIDLAAPRGRAVRASADGVVRWAEPVSFRGPGPYFRYGKIVAIRHGDRAVTIYGNLETIDVRRGQPLRRGDRIGTVGESPWFGAPRLRYEVWMLPGGEPAPIDPRLAILSDRAPKALEQLRRGARAEARREVALPDAFR
jgi:murein DD-endopeptidase MepM/ murein hydrolase activator NlpD